MAYDPASGLPNRIEPGTSVYGLQLIVSARVKNVNPREAPLEMHALVTIERDALTAFLTRLAEHPANAPIPASRRDEYALLAARFPEGRSPSV